MSIISRKLKKDVNNDATGELNPSEKKLETKYSGGGGPHGFIGDILNFMTNSDISKWLKLFVVFFLILLVILWQGTPAIVGYYFSVDAYLADRQYEHQSRDNKRTELLESFLLNRPKSASRLRNFTSWKSRLNLGVKKHGWSQGKRNRHSTDLPAEPTM